MALLSADKGLRLGGGVHASNLPGLALQNGLFLLNGRLLSGIPAGGWTESGEGSGRLDPAYYID